jgi:hypothetical protein
LVKGRTREAGSIERRARVVEEAKMNWSLRSSTSSLVALVVVGASATPAAERSPSSLTFEHLASLVGEWKVVGVQAGSEAQVTYRLIADGSVLMEEFRPKDGPVMVTMFSVDGDRLIATHYCSARNQPQMATAALTEPDVKSLAFSLVRVTGLKSPEDWHNTGLVVTLEEGDRFTQEWTYQHEGTTGKNFFHFTRER